MTDIAALGLRVESDQVTKAAAELQKLTSSAKTAETAAKSVGTASAGMSQEMQTAVARAAAMNQRLATVGRQAALSSHQLTNLAFQLNDVATMAAMGADPLRILASQAGQFYQVLATGEGGARGSVSYLKDLLVGMVTPARLVAGGLAAIGTTAVAAAVSSVNEMARIEGALLGVGRASGVTAQEIRAMSVGAAEAGRNTVGGAQEFAVALAATGRVNEEIIAGSLEVSRTLEKIYGDEAGAKLAKALADPVKGIETLQKELLAFDRATLDNIASLARQGDRLGAQREILRGLTEGIGNATAATTAWERAWNSTAGAMSTMFTKLGDAFNGDPVEAARKRLEDGPYRFRDLDQERRDRATLIEAQNRATQRLEAELRLKADEVASLARSIAPQVDDLRVMTDEWTRLSQARFDPAVTSRLSAMDNAALEKATDLLGRKVAFHKTAVEIAREELDTAVQYANARSAAQRADVVYAETNARLLREGKDNSQQIAEYERQKILAEDRAGNLRFLESRALYDEQNLQRSKMEIALIGQTEIAAAGMRAEFDAMAEASRRATERGELVSEGDIERAKRLRSEAEGAAAALVNAKIQQDLAFERAQLSRSEREQSVYSRMQGLGLLTDGQIVGAQSEMIAQQIRFNEVMKLSQDMSTEFATGFVRDMKNGVDATEALASSLNRLADRFLDMAMDQTFSSLFAPFSQGVASGATGGSWAASITSGGGGLFGGMLIPGILHDGGMVGSGDYPHRAVPASVFAGAKRYHQGGVIGANEVPIIAEKGERVLTKAQQRALSSPAVNVVTNIDARGADPAAIERLRQDMAARDASMQQQVISIVRDATERRMI